MVYTRFDSPSASDDSDSEFDWDASSQLEETDLEAIAASWATRRQRGIIYYYNTLTGHSTYVEPPGFSEWEQPVVPEDSCPYWVETTH